MAGALRASQTVIGRTRLTIVDRRASTEAGNELVSPHGGGGHEVRGPVAYMVRNGVVANLLMFLIVASGLLSINGLVQEAFPVIAFDHIEVSVPYPGATPDQVEESIVLKVEEQVETVEGVREVSSVAAEGLASVIVGFRSGTDMDRALDEVQSAVGRIQTLPTAAERPDVRRMTNRQSVMRLVLYGDASERALKEVAYRTEDKIAALSAVSYVETSGVRDYEISIEVPLGRLLALGLTLEDIARRIRAESLDLSAGSIETRESELRVRTTNQRYDQHGFEDLVVLSQSDGTRVRLGDIATVRDGFEETDLVTRHNGQPAAFVEIYRTAGEQVLDVVAAVEDHLERNVIPSLPTGVAIEVWTNDADLYKDRLNLLLKNGLLGLILVLVSLTLFLQIRLALWVASGIAISFIGALAAALALGVSINTITLFAFLLAVGIVVDDAIVVAEQIHAERQKGTPGVTAAIRGAKRIQRPVTFAVLTTVAAFAPMLFLPGPLGQMLLPVPTILIAILLISLIESLLILPNHLSHLPGPRWKPANTVDRFFFRVQSRVDRAMRRFVEGPLDRGLQIATGAPGVVIAAGIGVVVLSVSLVPAGIIGVILVEPVEADIVTAHLEMPEGTPARRTAAVVREIEAAGYRAVERLSPDSSSADPQLSVGVQRTVGARPRQLGGSVSQEPRPQPKPHIGAVEFKLAPVEARDVTSGEFAQAWRDETGPVPEARSLTFAVDLIDLGAPVHAELSHPDPDRLAQIGEAVAASLRSLHGVFDIRSDHAPGLQELQLALQPEAHTLGLTHDALARQVRSAFFGDEVLRVQRGREEVRVYVRLPAEERNSLSDIEAYRIRTPTGATVPLGQIASWRLGRSPWSVHRKDGSRVVTVTAEVDPSVTTGEEATAFLESDVLPQLAAAHPGLVYSFGGEQQQQLESFDALGRGFVLALVVIYGLLAIPLGSYTRPFLIMSVIPFGVVGAIFGHLIMGLDLSATSMWGIIGLVGVVVNDSLVMVDQMNRRLNSGSPVRAAVIAGAKRRFRPIFVTSATTFLGFVPLIFESNIQAQFLIPLGVSVGFGIVVATGILMMIVPALAMVFFRDSLPAPAGSGLGHRVGGQLQERLAHAQ